MVKCRGLENEIHRKKALPGKWMSFSVAPRGVREVNIGFILTAYQ